MFRCPVCGEKLMSKEKSFICAQHHCYDRARQGYVNLLLSSQSHGKRHGDDRKMVLARQNFLDQGYYQPLADAILQIIHPFLSDGAFVLDVGCGECWYTAQVAQLLRQQFPHAQISGIDISKNALMVGAHRDRSIALAVASAYHLPFFDNCCDVLLNIFSPCATDEFIRVLKPGGILIRAVPLERHLWSLKSAVYEHPYENPAEKSELQGLQFIQKTAVQYRIHLPDPLSIQNLFCMTPYYYKTGKADQQKLSALHTLDTEAAFGVMLYQKAKLC